MLRCFIELKYLKEIDKIMFDCFWWHKYFPSFKKCTFSVYTKNNPQKKKKTPPEKPNQTTWLQGAFHWQFETEGNYTFLWIKKKKQKKNSGYTETKTPDRTVQRMQVILHPDVFKLCFFFCFLMPLGSETYCVSLPQKGRKSEFGTTNSS